MKARLLAFLWLLVALPVAASEAPAAPPPIYVQVWLGGQGTDDGSWKISDPQSGESALGDLGTLPFGGGAGQKLWGSGAWQIGFEGGGLVTWKNDRTDFRGTNNTLQVTIDNTFASFGVFMGGVVSVTPIRSLRLYLAAGPSLTWAWLHNDNDNQTPPPGGTTVDISGDANDVSVAPYARAGVEFVMDDGFTFGVSVRYADDQFHFGDAGDLEFDQVLWLLTLGSRL
jgi:hypothetical protein